MIEVPKLLQPVEAQQDQLDTPPSPLKPLAQAAAAGRRSASQDFVHSMETVATINPDQYAKASQVSRWSGIPAHVLTQHTERMDQLLRGNQYAGIYDRAQKTAEALRDGNLAAVSQDDVEQLIRIEQAGSDSRFNEQSTGEQLFNALRQSWVAGNQARDLAGTDRLNRISQQFDRIDTELAAASVAGREPFIEGGMPSGFGLDYLKATPEQRLEMRQNLVTRQGNLIDRATTDEQELRDIPVDPGTTRAQQLENAGASSLSATAEALIENPGYALRSSVGAVASSATMLLAGAVGGPLAAAPVGFGTEANAEFADVLREKGVDLTDPKQVLEALQDEQGMADARAQAARKAAGTTAVDVVSMGLAGRLLAPSRIAGRQLSASQRELANLMVQMPVQGVLEGAGEAAGQLAATGEVDAGEVLLESVAGAGMSSVEVLAFGGARVWENLSKGLASARQARAGADSLGEMVDAAVNGKTRGRDPETFKAIALQQLKDSPMEEIWIPAEALQRLNQDEKTDLTNLMQQVPGLTEQFADAQARGGSVAMKTADYLTTFADYHDQLSNSIRVQADGMSLEDAKTWTAEQDEVIRNLAETISAEPDAQAQAYNDFLGQLIQSGYRRADAEQYAATHLSVLSNLAERTGMAIEQLQQQFPLTVRSQAPEQLQRFTEDQVRGAITELRTGAPAMAEQEGQQPQQISQEARQIGSYLDQLGVDLEQANDDEVVQLLRGQGQQAAGRRLEQFAGPTAWTADVAALDDARQQIAAGGNPEQVRQDTGWFEGADGKWRFEIDDSAATFKPLEDWVERAEEPGRVTLRDVLDHSALFAAYPEIGRVEIRVNPSRRGGGYFAGQPGRGFSGAFIEIGDPSVYEGDPAIDVLMHEIQHAIQMREGFATGGSPDVLRAEKDQAMDDRNYWSSVAAIRREADRNGGDYEQARQDYIDVFEETPTDQQMEEARWSPSIEQLDQRVAEAETIMREIGNPTSTYNRLAGEIEARNTEARRTMTAAERRAASPEQTADVPREQAIVRWNGTEMLSPTVNAAAGIEQRLNQSDLERLASMTEDQYIAAVNPTEKTTAEDDVVLVSIGDLDLPSGAQQVAEFNDNDGNPVQVFATEDGGLYAQQDGQVVGQIETQDGETLNIVAREVQGKGIGTGLAAEMIRRDPFAQAGSFSPAGERTRRAAFRRVKAEQQQRLEQAGEDDARGFITFTPRGQGDRRFQITLGEKRDLSTVLHELGHYYLEVIDDIAAGQNPPAQVADDVAKLRKWLGAEEGKPLTTEQHEQFARGFEHYLAEGKAPNPELAGAFARFKRWLIAVYKDLRRLNVELTDEVRQVFDRLVATDEQITRAEQVTNAIPLFKDAQAAGMTDAEFGAYQNSIELAHADARDAVEEEVMREEERRQSKWWRERQAEVQQEVSDEVDTLPGFAAVRALRRGIMPDGSTTTVKLNSAELAERFGADVVRRMAFTHSKSGLPVDMVAELLGFTSADQMVQEIMSSPNRSESIRQEVARRMEERYGPRTTGEAAERAIDAVHNDRRADVLIKELNRLAQVGNRRNATSQQILKEAARRIMAERRVRDIQPAEYQRAEAKAAREAFQAFTKGDLEAAYQAKQRELMNFYLYREAVKARAEIDKIVERMAKFNKRSTRERIGKAGHDYLDQIDAVMEQYEFRTVSLRQMDKAQSAAQWYADQVAAGNDPYVPEFVLNTAQKVNYKDLSLDQLQELDEYTANIQHLASIKNKLLKNRKIKDIAEGKALLTASAFENVEKKGRRELVENARSLPQVAADWLARGNSSLLKMEQVIDWLDGGDPNGAWGTLIFQPLADAQHEADDLNREYTQKIVDLHEQWIKDRGSNIGERFHVRSINQTMTTSGMLAVALNTGNASNQKKLLEGYGWDQSVVNEILGHMTKADWQYVASMWDTVESLWPQIEALEKRVNGIAPPKIEGLTIETPFGTVKGGYWPLVYDPLSTRYADVLSNLGGLAPLGEGGTVRATPPRGHTQARVDAFSAPILLDASVIANHLNQVILDLTHREVLRDVRKLYTGETREAVTQTLGPDMAAQIVNMFDGIATGQSSGNLKAIGTFARTMNALRTNQSLAWMGYSLTTVFNQLGGYSQGLEYFAKKGGRKYIYRAFLKYWGSPLENLKMIREMSGEMRNRAINLDASIREAQTQVLRMKDGRFVQDTFKGMQNGRDVMVKYAFVPMQVMQGLVDGVVWMAGYEQAGGVNNHDDAVQAADRAVRLTQTAGGAKDLATIQQNILAKLFLPVYGYASLLWNRNVDLARDAVSAVKQRDAVQVLVAFERFVYLNIIPAFIAALIKGGLPDDDDDDETWLGWLGVSALSSVSQGIPIVGQGVAGAFSDFGYSGASPIGQGLDALIRASSAEKEQTITTNAINAVGAFTGLPASQINRAVRTYFMSENGEMEDSATAIARGVLLGPPTK